MWVYRAAMMALLSVLCVVSPVWAGVSPGSGSFGYWQEAPVQSMRTFQLDQANAPTIRVYIAPASATYRQYVAAGLTTWSRALDGRLKAVEVATPEQADIKIYWVQGFASPSQGGETEFMEGEATLYIKASGIPANLIEANILHELGHALGIANHSHENDDIMKSGRSWHSMSEYRNYQPQLSSRDVDAIRRLYSSQWVPNEDLYQPVRRQATVWRPGPQ